MTSEINNKNSDNPNLLIILGSIGFLVFGGGVLVDPNSLNFIVFFPLACISSFVLFFGLVLRKPKNQDKPVPSVSFLVFLSLALIALLYMVGAVLVGG